MFRFGILRMAAFYLASKSDPDMSLMRLRRGLMRLRRGLTRDRIKCFNKGKLHGAQDVPVTPLRHFDVT